MYPTEVWDKGVSLLHQSSCSLQPKTRDRRCVQALIYRSIL